MAACFPFYTDFFITPKIASLLPNEQLLLIKLICINNEWPLENLEEKDIAACLGISIDEAVKFHQELVEKCFIRDNWQLRLWADREAYCSEE